MSGRPVRLLTAAAIAAAASLLSIASASAGCYSCGASYSYAAPVAYYTAPVVYSYSYAAPAAYAAPSCGCGGYTASAPMYVVNQGPTYNAPVTVDAEQEPAYEPSYRRGYSYYGEGGPRWRHRHWHRGLGYRGLGYRGLGYRGLGYRGLGYRGFRHSLRYNMRHPMVGPGGIYRPRHATGLIPPRHWTGAVAPHRMGGQMHMMRTPGVVHPRKMP
jgi:hypothetical protein